MKQHKLERWFFLLFALISIFMMLFPTFFAPFSQNFFTVSSFLQLQVSRGLKVFEDSILLRRNVAQLRKEYENFLEYYARSKEGEKVYEQLLQENVSLRELLQYSYDITQHYQVARVSSVTDHAGRPSIHLGLGSADGIQERSAILAPYQDHLVLVGIIRKVGSHSSIAVPLSDPSSRIAVRLRDIQYDGLLGGARTHMLMRYVDLDAEQSIKVGDIVVSDLSSSLVPPDIHIGTVRNIIQKSHELSLELEIEPFLSFHNLEYVFVVSVEKK